jgi:hypothetical protein
LALYEGRLTIEDIVATHRHRRPVEHAIEYTHSRSRHRSRGDIFAVLHAFGILRFGRGRAGQLVADEGVGETPVKFEVVSYFLEGTEVLRFGTKADGVVNLRDVVRDKRRRETLPAILDQ